MSGFAATFLEVVGWAVRRPRAGIRTGPSVRVFAGHDSIPAIEKGFERDLEATVFPTSNIHFLCEDDCTTTGPLATAPFRRKCVPQADSFWLYHRMGVRYTLRRPNFWLRAFDRPSCGSGGPLFVVFAYGGPPYWQPLR